MSHTIEFVKLMISIFYDCWVPLIEIREAYQQSRRFGGNVFSEERTIIS